MGGRNVRIRNAIIGFRWRPDTISECRDTLHSTAVSSRLRWPGFNIRLPKSSRQWHRSDEESVAVLVPFCPACDARSVEYRPPPESGSPRPRRGAGRDFVGKEANRAGQASRTRVQCSSRLTGPHAVVDCRSLRRATLGRASDIPPLGRNVRGPTRFQPGQDLAIGRVWDRRSDLARSAGQFNGVGP